MYFSNPEVPSSGRVVLDHVVKTNCSHFRFWIVNSHVVDKASDLKESIDLIDSNCQSGMHLSVYGVTVILLDLWII